MRAPVVCGILACSQVILYFFIWLTDLYLTFWISIGEGKSVRERIYIFFKIWEDNHVVYMYKWHRSKLIAIFKLMSEYNCSSNRLLVKF